MLRLWLSNQGLNPKETEVWSKIHVKLFLNRDCRSINIKN